MRERRSLPIVLAALLLLVAAGLVGPIVAGPYLPRLLFLSGLLLALGGAVTAFRPLVAFTRRMSEVAEPGPFTIWLTAGAVLLVLAVGFGIQVVRLDLTSRGANRLSEPTRRALARGGAPIEMIAVYRDGQPEAERARDLLRLYGEAGTGIRVSALDPERDPDTARRLGVDFRDAILVRADTVREVVPDISEAALSAAVLRVRDPERPLLAVLDGHGEQGPGRAGLAQLRKLAANSGVELRTLRLAETGAVPLEVQAVLIVGPEAPLLPGEIAAINRFLERGGRLGVFTEPNRPTGLETMLAARGLVFDGRRIRDEGPRARSIGLGPETIPTQNFGEHDITQRLTLGVVLRGATSARLAEKVQIGSSGGNLLIAAPSAHFVEAAEPADPSRPPSTGVSVPPPPPTPGPIVMAAALQWDPAGPANVDPARPPERRHCRVVVAGDSDFLRDDAIGLAGNRAFAGRVAGWLAEREYAFEFPPPDQGGTPLLLGLAGFRLIGFILLLLLPGAMFGLGVATWLRRR